MVWRWLAATALVPALAVGGFLLFGRVGYAPLPARNALLNPERQAPSSSFTLNDIDGPAPELGGMRAVDDAFVELGRDAFCRETFRNEYFLTDVMGLLDGAVGPWQITKAVIGLRG